MPVPVVARVLLVAMALAACGHPSTPSPAHIAPPPNTPIASNVWRADYAGSSACADCHDKVYKQWAGSPMRNMTRDASTAVIRAPFDGATLHVGADSATMETVGGARQIVVRSPTGDHTFRITKVVGGRYREDFVGVEDGSPIERVLPATYVFATKTWRYKGYSVMVPERPAMSWKGEWAKECIGCHNTLPLVTMAVIVLPPPIDTLTSSLTAPC